MRDRARGVRRPTAQAAGGILFLTLVCSVVAHLLLNYAFRSLPAGWRVRAEGEPKLRSPSAG
jgi:hypothetical protein